MPRRNLAWLLGVAAVCLFGLAVAQQAPTAAEDDDYELVRLMVDTLHKVRKNYVTELDKKRMRKLAEDMLNGGLERLDPHSSYINAREYKHFTKQSEGKFGGIGIQLGYDRVNRNQLTIISPMVGTPAYDAGILAGDALVKIDGKSTEMMRLSEAVDLIQGDAGQKITLTVRHEGSTEENDVEIVRAEIKVQTVLGDLRKKDNLQEWDFLYDRDEKIGYIRLTGFNQTSFAELKAALDELEKAGMRGLILDLRGNPGGLLKSAVEICDLFLEPGQRIVSTKGRNHKDEIHDAKPGTKVLAPADKHPIAILINRYSASASEILSAALQDHGRAVIVGERSYGKGSVQNVLEMEKNTSALKLTTASYWRPSGKNIHRFEDSKESDEWGVKPTPGFEVTLKDDERLDYLLWRNDRDVVRKTPKPEKPKAEDDKQKKKGPFVDRVMEKAVEHIKSELHRIGRAAELERGDA
jgi:carboxyl-terminal processing protease